MFKSIFIFLNLCATGKEGLFVNFFPIYWHIILFCDGSFSLNVYLIYNHSNHSPEITDNIYLLDLVIFRPCVRMSLN